MARRKEVHFFDDESPFENGSPDEVPYHEAFSPTDPAQLLGESTPAYMYWTDALRRIWRYNPAMKLILLLRNPIERAYSHWNMARLENVDRLSLMTDREREFLRRTFEFEIRGLERLLAWDCRHWLS
jgi:hypothetical protein